MDVRHDVGLHLRRGDNDGPADAGITRLELVVVGFTVLVAPPSAIVKPLRCALAKFGREVVAVVEATCTVS